MITSEDILKLDLHPNSVVFVDVNAVDLTELENADWPAEIADVPIIGIVLRTGSTVADSIFHLTKEDACEILLSIINRG